MAVRVWELVVKLAGEFAVNRRGPITAVLPSITAILVHQVNGGSSRGIGLEANLPSDRRRRACLRDSPAKVNLHFPMKAV